jgi:lipoate-protein ligase A
MKGMRTGSQRVRSHDGHRWRFVDSGRGDPFFNMALDEAIARTVARGKALPTVRVYGWDPAAVSIGYAQRAQQVIDLTRCARQGIPVVRRLTGGRAVLHEREVTYSVAALRRQWGPAVSVLSIYKYIGRALVAALRHLGIRAQLSRPPWDRTASLRRPGNAHPCFSSAGRYEVMVRGRKLVGSAQRWLEDVVLQHGSVLLGQEHSRLAELLPAEQGSSGRRAARQLTEKTISLSVLLSRPVSHAEVSQALRSGFEEMLAGRLEAESISPQEEALARSLVQERYGRLEWTLRA